MNNLAYLSFSVIIIAGLVLTAFTDEGAVDDVTANFETGAPGQLSIGELSFGPQGILFFGDSQGASVYALETNDGQGTMSSSPLEVADIQGKIAQRLGAGADDISVQDMAVHPVSNKVYLSLSRGQGNSATYHIVTVSGDGVIEEMNLDNVSFSSFQLQTAPAAGAADGRGNSLRSSSITDLSYSNGEVYVAGISNEEFASGFRQIVFPFEGEESLTTLEIYHVSHGQYETNAPIRTFVPYSMNGSDYILAGYTCTPLVLFSMDNLADGQHVRGRTIAELGNRNRPLDIIPYTDSEGNNRLMIAHSSYSVMRVNPGEFAGQSHLDQPLDEGEQTTGVGFESLDYTNVLHMDNLNDDYLVMLQQMDDGTIDMRSISK